MLTQKQIKTQLAQIKTSRDKLRDKLHVIAISIIGHAHEHGDVTLADSLMTAMGRGMDRQAMIWYLEANGPFKFEAKAGKFAMSKKKRDEMEFDEEFLLSTEKWYEYGKETRAMVSSYDILKRAEGLLESLQKAAKEGKPTKHDDFAGYLRTALVKYYEDSAAEA